MKNDRRNFPANDFDDGDKKNSSGGDFTKEKKWLIIKLLIVIIPGILYWVTSDDNFEKKVSVNVAVDAGVSSKKTDSTSETLPLPAKNSQDNIALAQKKYDEGYAAFKRNDYAAAVNFFTQAIELNPNHSYAYHDRGMIYQLTQNPAQALSDVNKAIQLEPNMALMYNTRAYIYRSLKNFNQAISDFDTAIQLGANFSAPINLAITYQCRGICYQQLGDNAKAQADFGQAKILGYNGN